MVKCQKCGKKLTFLDKTQGKIIIKYCRSCEKKEKEKPKNKEKEKIKVDKIASMTLGIILTIIGGFPTLFLIKVLISAFQAGNGVGYFMFFILTSPIIFFSFIALCGIVIISNNLQKKR